MADPHPAPDLRLLAAALLAASVAALGGALVMEHWGGFAPCVLCLYQRIPYVAAIGLALLALGLGARPGAARAQGWLVYLCGAVFLAGAGIAAFHVGVEQGWWEGTTACGAGPRATTLEELRAQLEATPIVRCDEVAWSLFGISLAGYNLLLSLGLAALCFAGPTTLSRRAARAGQSEQGA